MVGDVTVEMMSDSLIVWRCLHCGPLNAGNMDLSVPEPREAWDRFRARNIPLLRALTAAYDSCAVLARDGDQVVGQLRFYPKAVCREESMGMLCLQQDFPAGPREDLSGLCLPLLANLPDKTLLVHCLMTGSPGQKENPYQRKGIGARMARCLTDWARQHGWQAVEARANADLDVLYNNTGTAGRTFWKKLGFREIDTKVQFTGEEHPFVKSILREAQTRGMDPTLARSQCTMRLELA
jgi:hypothetical protein